MTRINVAQGFNPALAGCGKAYTGDLNFKAIKYLPVTQRRLCFNDRVDLAAKSLYWLAVKPKR